MRRIGIHLAISGLVLAACNAPSGPAADVADAADSAVETTWRTDLDEWKAQRDERLRQPTGWLSLAGLFWLEEGESTVGSDPSSDLVFPPAAPSRLGVFERHGTEFTFVAEPGIELSSDGEPVTRLALASDASGAPTTLTHGSLSFYVIERGKRVGVRLKDSESELIASFEGMEYYPVDASWRIDARFEIYEEPRTIAVPNVIGGTLESSAPGVAVFEIDGREYRLEPTGDPADEMFFVFGDETNGAETYGGGRFLYAGPPAADGSIVLDFNRAYNPPCVFTPYATCPLPRPEDKLALEIEAGEKTFGAPH